MTPRWAVVTSMVLALGALAVSVYLTIAHFTDPDVLVCSGSGAVNCAKVTTSAQSSLLGVPVAVLGLLWSVVTVAICLPAAWRSRRLHVPRIALMSAGVAFVLWLIYAELFLIRSICLWCSVVHVLVFGLFVTVVLEAVAEPSGS